MTFVAGLRCDGLAAPCLLQCPINTRSFLAWVEQALVPPLWAGDIVVMDNLSSHKSPNIRRAIRNAGVKLKALLRKKAQRNLGETCAEIGRSLDKFSPKECEITSETQGMCKHENITQGNRVNFSR